MNGRLAVAAFGLLLGCGRGQYVAVNVQVVIPAEVRTITDGELLLRLWSYDPTVADLAATMTDVQSVSLSHAAGQRNVVPMRVSGRIFYGWRYYISVQGCEGSLEVLWDGLVGVGAPRVVEMQSRAEPFPPCISSKAALP